MNCPFESAILLHAVALFGCLAMSAEDAKRAGETEGPELVIVKDGVSLAPIVTVEGAPPYTREAAGELAVYIEKISGAKPEIIKGAPAPVPEHAIWVGYQPILGELFPNLDLDFNHPEEILIAANGDHLVIAGRNRWNPDSLVVESAGPHQARITGRQWEYGTANAVYEFLRKYLDVLWLWPGELGEDIVRKDTISFAPFEYRYHPQIRQRGTIFRFSALGDKRGHSHEWTRRQGLQLDSMQTPGGHAFYTWWDRFHKEHPDYFALQPDGTRSGFPAPKRAKLCQSNPAVWEQWLADVTEELRENPHETIFNAAPNDSAQSGVCVCEKCRAWDQPGAATYPYQWDGVTRKDVAMSDRYCTFTNHLARKLKERFPGRDYRVLQFAYHCTTWAPLKAVPEDNVIISYIGNFPLTDEADRREQKKKMAGWQTLGPAMVYRPNQWVFAGALGLPQVAPGKVIDDFAFLAKNNCVGMFVDTAWEHWATTGPHYYLIGRLGWDPTQDGDAILDEYYQRGFGAAADDIRAYWQMMADEFGDLGYRERLDAVVKTRFDETFRSKAGLLLDRAAAKVADAPDVHRKRVAFVRAGFDYTRVLFELLAFMKRTENDEGPETREEAKAYWKRIREIADPHPYALNYRWLPNRMARKGRYVPPDMD